MERVETTRLEKILAALLVIFILIGGTRALLDVGKLVEKPRYEDFLDRYNVSGLRADLYSLSSRLSQLDRERSDAYTEYLRAREEYEFYREEYRTSLEKGNLSEELERRYEEARREYLEKKSIYENLDRIHRELRDRMRSLESELARREDLARKSYSRAMLVYNTKVFALRIILLLPLIGLSLFLHARTRSLPTLSLVASSFILLGYSAVEFAWRGLQVYGVSALGILGTILGIRYARRLALRDLPYKRVEKGDCPYCGYSAGNSSYCPNCGRELVRKCPRCGAIVRKFTRFCWNCGEKLE